MLHSLVNSLVLSYSLSELLLQSLSINNTMNSQIQTWIHWEEQFDKIWKICSWKSDFNKLSASSNTIPRTFFNKDPTRINYYYNKTLKDGFVWRRSMKRPGVAMKKLLFWWSLYNCWSRDSPPINNAVRTPTTFKQIDFTTSSIWIANSRFGTSTNTMKSVKLWNCSYY